MWHLAVGETAARDIETAVAWYDGAGPGLGDAFVRELRQALLRIQLSPMIYPQYLANLSCAPVRRFPYGVFFTARTGAITVDACLPGKRSRSVIAGPA